MKKKFGEWTLYSGDDISNEIFEGMLELDSQLFTEEDGTSLGKEYIRSLYKDSKDGVFIIRNERTHEIVGYNFSITVSEEQLQQYLEDHDHSKLDNIGMKEGNNNLYIYTLATNPKYRNSISQKILGKAFAEYIMQCKEEGKEVGYCFAEAVSSDGARALSKSMGMVKFRDGHDTEELGFYHYETISDFEEYIERMSRFDYSLFTKPYEENPIPKREVSASEVGEVAEGVAQETSDRAMAAVSPNKKPVVNKDGQTYDDE